eukprot:PhF_6_TR13425/c0_g1_i2/m.21411
MEKAWTQLIQVIDELSEHANMVSFIHSDVQRLHRCIITGTTHLRRRLPTVKKDAYYVSYLNLMKEVLNDFLSLMQKECLVALPALETTPNVSQIYERFEWTLNQLLKYGYEYPANNFTIATHTPQMMLHNVNTTASLGTRIVCNCIVGPTGSGKSFSVSQFEKQCLSQYPRVLHVSIFDDWLTMPESYRYFHVLSLLGVVPTGGVEDIDEQLYALHISSVPTHIIVHNVTPADLPEGLLTSGPHSLESFGTMWRHHAILGLAPYVTPVRSNRILLTIIVNSEKEFKAQRTVMPTYYFHVVPHAFDSALSIPIFSNFCPNILSNISKSISLFNELRTSPEAPFVKTLIAKCASLQGTEVDVDSSLSKMKEMDSYLLGPYLGRAVGLLHHVIGYRPISLRLASCVLAVPITEGVEILEALIHLGVMRSYKTLASTGYEGGQVTYEEDFWNLQYYLSDSIRLIRLDPYVTPEALQDAGRRYEEVLSKSLELFEWEVKLGIPQKARQSFGLKIPHFFRFLKANRSPDVSAPVFWKRVHAAAHIMNDRSLILREIKALHMISSPEMCPAVDTLGIQFLEGHITDMVESSNAQDVKVVLASGLSEYVKYSSEYTEHTELCALAAYDWTCGVEGRDDSEETLIARLRLAYVMAQRTKHHAATDAISKCNKILPTLSCGLLSLARIHTMWCQISKKLGDSDDYLRHAVHALECVQRIHQVIPYRTVEAILDVIRALLNCGKYFEVQGFIDRAFGVFSSQEKTGELPDPNLKAKILYYCGKSQFLCGDYSNALSSLKEALELAETSFGDKHLTSKIFGLLGRTCGIMSPTQPGLLGNFVQSQMGQALEVASTVSGAQGRHLITRQQLRKSVLLLEGGDSFEAEMMCLKTLWNCVAPKTHGPKSKPETSTAHIIWWKDYSGNVMDPYGVLKTCSTLSRIYHTIGEAQNALLFAESSLKYANVLYGEKAKTKYHIAGYILMGEALAGTPEGLEWTTRALTTARSLYGDVHETTLHAMHCLGWSLEQIRKLDAAHSIQKQAYEMVQEGTLPISLTARISTITWYGVSCIHVHEYNEGLSALKIGLELQLATFGKRSLQYASVLQHVAAATYHLGKLRESRKQYEECLEVLRETCNKSNPLLHRALTNLAAVIQDMYGDPREAEALLMEALHMRLQSVYCTPLDVASSYSNLAFCYYRQRKSPVHTIENWIKLVEAEEEEQQRALGWGSVVGKIWGRA